MSDFIKTVNTQGIFDGAMHDCSVRFALAGPWYMTGWSSSHRVVGTCAVCGQGIANVVRVTSRAGRHETLGFDCATTLFVNQKDKAELARVKAAQSEHGRALRLARKNKLEETKARRVGKCAAILMSEPMATRYKAQPHPHEYWSQRGKTMFDYLGFCLGNGAVGAMQMIERDSAALDK